jgi:DNA-3-methyladenine glycosylase
MATPAVLPRAFFARATEVVARDLLGCVLWADADGLVAAGRIVEVEAYLGEDDAASHAGRGPTPRSAIMFGPPGVAYVYFVYGMHHCVNAVTGPVGAAGAVLLRALEPVVGWEVMTGRSPGIRRPVDLCRGPGRLCRSLGVDLAWSGLPLSGRRARARGAARRLWVEAAERPPARIVVTPRIGVRRAADRLLRFVDAQSPCLSGKLRVENFDRMSRLY